MFNRIKIEEGWFTLLLVWGLVSIAVAAIINADLIPGLEYLPFIATAGILTGLVLAKSKFSGQTAFLLALIYGLFVVTVVIGRELPGDLTWRERVGDLIGRQLTWVGKAVTQGSSRDGLIFVIQTSFIFWFLATSAAWFTFRGAHVWRIVLPSGLVLLSVVYYYYGPKPLVAYLALYTLVALVFIARSHLVSQEKRWHSGLVRYEKGIRFSFLQASIIAALITLGIAWILPTAPASAAVGNLLGESGVQTTWEGFQENWTRLFSSLRSYNTGTNDLYTGTLALGGPRSVGESLIMDVSVSSRLPYVYWQAVAYDTYNDGSWSISDSEKELHLPDDGPLNIPQYALREEVNQTVTNYIPNAGTIYGAPEVSGSNRQLFVSKTIDGTGKDNVHFVQSRFVMRQGDQYEVTSNYSLADATSLQDASQEYPEWVTEQYLQMPETITPETVDLAAELTAGLTNPFDKAVTIRDYLRDNIAYNDQIDAPPDISEPIHYILFDLQEAYCNYYASAMIMMLRSQGIPSRFVSGYAQGEWVEEAATYRVRSLDSHSWVEVYFPEYGWILFEPTASLPVGDRPETSNNPGDAFGIEDLLELDDTRPFDERNLGEGIDDFDRLAALLAGEEEEELAAAAAERRTRIIQIAVALVLVIPAVMVTVLAARTNRRVEASVERSYGRLANWGRWFGVVVRPAHTPYERADMLAAAVPDGKESLRSLTHQYVRQLFSPDKGKESEYTPRDDWKILRPIMLRGAISYQLNRIRGRWRKN
ncbi:MAG TPA: transglutaminase domain-containing protein [candidate division Zixibacteria bacterium]|nr:transglutaminase domain-containing protein [candidate division Zixibacteria bacterium]